MTPWHNLNWVQASADSNRWASSYTMVGAIDAVIYRKLNDTYEIYTPQHSYIIPYWTGLTELEACCIYYELLRKYESESNAT
jgi:hypothetical protein